MFQKYPKKFGSQLFIILHILFLLSFLFISKTLRFNNLKTRTTTNVKNPAFVVCDEVIIYLLLYNLRESVFLRNPFQSEKQLI